MRYSQQREIIRDIVFSTNSHPTADWVYGKAKKSMPNISLGTVYRNLKQLTDQHIIKTIYDGTIARYDWNKESHDHLKCVDCGEMVDIQTSNRERLKTVVNDEYNFDITDVEITFIGKCHKHDKKKKRSS